MGTNVQVVRNNDAVKLGRCPNCTQLVTFDISEERQTGTKTGERSMVKTCPECKAQSKQYLGSYMI